VKKVFFFVKKIQTQKLEGIWDFKYELVMAIRSPHNKLIFILALHTLFFSLNFFYEQIFLLRHRPNSGKAHIK